MISTTSNLQTFAPITLTVGPTNTNFREVERYLSTIADRVFVLHEREMACALDRIRLDIEDFAQLAAEMKLAFREAREIRHTRLRLPPPPERRRWKRRTCGEASRWRVMV